VTNKFSLVVFDLDGTLSDTHQLIFDSFNFVMRKYKSVELTPEEIMSYFGPPEEVCIKNMIGADHFMDAWRGYLEYYDMHLDETVIFPGVQELLNNLKSSGTLLGIFTGKGKETTESTLKFHGIRNLFDIVVTGSGVKNHKPHPEGVELALRQLKVHAQDSVLVGDSLSDYKAAGSAGTGFIAATYDRLSKNHFDGIECKRAKSVHELSELLLKDSGR
jgi:HAD superfamily hydrolase (TIGR01509 family)